MQCRGPTETKQADAFACSYVEFTFKPHPANSSPTPASTRTTTNHSYPIPNAEPPRAINKSFTSLHISLKSPKPAPNAQPIPPHNHPPHLTQHVNPCTPAQTRPSLCADRARHATANARPKYIYSLVRILYPVFISSQSIAALVSWYLVWRPELGGRVGGLSVGWGDVIVRVRYLDGLGLWGREREGGIGGWEERWKGKGGKERKAEYLCASRVLTNVRRT